jgi:hypothetical protein
MTSHPKRPRDPNQLAKSIIDIATGEKPDRDPTPEEQGKDPAAVAMGKKGGRARAEGEAAVDAVRNNSRISAWRDACLPSGPGISNSV